ncbi:LVIVD repeat-containing protein [Streptosporangium sp. NPDC087985]|uniref:LVIVD repeat-containing protein n=1 Tax=Streptosporangium sp. NPDC087985 TaxID=3366196 RepID=UPI003809E95E
MITPRRKGLTGRILMVAGVVAAMSLSMAPAQADGIPAPGEIVMSSNMTHVTNVPKPAGLTDINSDMAFQGDYAYVGNYSGFSIYDIKNPKKTSLVSSVVCPGGQMDMAVYGNLLFGAVDSSRNDDSCNSKAQSASIKSSWEGIRIFDISDKKSPKYIKSVETDCGSHTLTLVPGKGEDKGNMYVYVSSYSPSASFPDCQPPHDKISIVKVPLGNPTEAAVVNTPVLFPDGGHPGNSLPYPYRQSATTGCHDITAYPERDIAAGACMGNGILMDISDPVNPKVTATARDDANFAFWHSATFNNDGTKVIFTDELGGGSAATCNEAIGPNRGANAYFDIVNGQLEFRSYFKIPRHQADTENCVAHNGSLIPVKGKDIMVQAWYQGGISVVDFTDSSNPHEIAFFERGPDNTAPALSGGFWSSYYYNGYIYGSDFNLGLDVVEINDPRTNQGKSFKFDIMNAQTQGAYGHGSNYGQ